jgi:mono/diheme cytochrome c family protein
MDFQAKAKSDTAFDEFPDGRANRGEIPGTVARGFNKEADPEYWYGLTGYGTPNQGWTTDFPAVMKPISLDDVERGRERFDIYCAPCHGRDGQGMGTVPKRLEQAGKAWTVANLTAPDKVMIPNGQLFNTISHGKGTMLGYAAQIAVEDRWKIILYVRALQRSQHPAPGDAR